MAFLIKTEPKVRLYDSTLPPITAFRNAHVFLSNFHPSVIVIEPQEDMLFPIAFPDAEHAYQYFKTMDKGWREKILNAATPGEAKRLGKQVPLRNEWEKIKEEVMIDVLRLKFKLPEMHDALAVTERRELIEGNNWGDRYWGVCNGRGLNRLGILLMQVRWEIANG